MGLSLQSGEDKGEYVKTFLHNQRLTSISERNNIKFKLSQEAFYNPKIHEIPKKISKSKKKQAIDDSQPEEQAEQGPSTPSMGAFDTTSHPILELYPTVLSVKLTSRLGHCSEGTSFRIGQ
ncbi:hypothetical protein DY000_02047503 [Brassica cretica]|uniref:Uncharacterized protein n=1 Tax=Brassica cretica TaxID=69181 RepID=A0ABQ7EYS1_BRACR|nr:hypothetical protein DY000_02047503 [Brassica cretica]